MTDRDIQAEIEANNRRKEAQDNEDDGSIVDAFEDALDPITDAIHRSGDDDNGDLAEERRELNDEEQRSS
jgi:hypothetical protein